jgi:hypothetical protein
MHCARFLIAAVLFGLLLNVSGCSRGAPDSNPKAIDVKPDQRITGPLKGGGGAAPVPGK